LALEVYHNKLITDCNFADIQLNVSWKVNFSAKNAISQGGTAADLLFEISKKVQKM